MKEDLDTPENSEPEMKFQIEIIQSFVICYITKIGLNFSI